MEEIPRGLTILVQTTSQPTKSDSSHPSHRHTHIHTDTSRTNTMTTRTVTTHTVIRNTFPAPVETAISNMSTAETATDSDTLTQVAHSVVTGLLKSAFVSILVSFMFLRNNNNNCLLHP